MYADEGHFLLIVITAQLGNMTLTFPPQPPTTPTGQLTVSYTGISWEFEGYIVCEGVVNAERTTFQLTHVLPL